MNYDFERFRYNRNRFEVNIGDNFFSIDKIILDIYDDVKINGQLEFNNIISWPVTLMSPGVMGWYGYLPIMECYHGVLNFNHEISGVLNIDGEEEQRLLRKRLGHFHAQLLDMNADKSF